MNNNQSAKIAKSKKKAKTRKAIVNKSYSFSGPIPHPMLLNQYDERTRKIIVAMAKGQMSHRHSIESSVIQSNIKNERTGMLLAAFLTFSLIIAGVVLLALGKDIAGYASIFGPTFFHAGNYIYNKKQEKETKTSGKEKKKKDKQVASSAS